MIKNLNDLQKLKQVAQKKMFARLNKSPSEIKSESKNKQILVCSGTGCTASNSEKIILALQTELKKNHLEKTVEVIKTGCFGLCALGPIMVIYPEKVFYSNVKISNIPQIITRHILKREFIKRFEPQEKVLSQMPFYAKQRRIVLKNCGVINPENIEEYIAQDGYAALGKALAYMTPEDVIKEIKDSGLRGRGGGGFLTGLKWEMAAKNISSQKCICCNADEGDPGAFMDRSILEGDPHAILEAMAIAGYAVGAQNGYIYVRAEYPVAVKRLEIAIKQSKEYRFLGKNIFSTGFDFDIELRLGAGAFVCGEETALMASIEGKRGEPIAKPPFPTKKGLYGVPTVLNNVETYANIPQIICKGASWFKNIGTKSSTGTKVFALGGKIKHTGLVEVPMGTTLRDIIYKIGGGIPDGKNFKAVQTGGPSGGCIPEACLDVNMDYDSLKNIGSMMGSGGLIVMDEDSCMVDVAKFFLKFTVDESCGKCTPCRLGTKRLLELLEKITSGQAQLDDIEKMGELCYYIKRNSLCGLGQTAPNPVLSTLKYFRGEYEAHILEKKCPAKVCKSLRKYIILKEKCRGCTACARKCPAGAISGSVKSSHEIDENKCVKCGTCKEVCKFGAIKLV